MGDGGSPQHSPWFATEHPEKTRVFVNGTPKQLYQLIIEWGRSRRQTVETLSRERITTALTPEVRNDLVRWRLLSASKLRAPTRGANAIRVVLNRDGEPGSRTTITSPVSYTTTPLGQRLENAVVLPNVAMLFPCARQPKLRDGVVQTPLRIVAVNNTWPIGIGTGPFDGVTDLYWISRVPFFSMPRA